MKMEELFAEYAAKKYWIDIAGPAVNSLPRTEAAYKSLVGLEAKMRNMAWDNNAQECMAPEVGQLADELQRILADWNK
jgi:hypothetical protein